MDLAYFSNFLIVVFASYFITKLSISPIYFTAILGFANLILIAIHRKNVRLNRSGVFALLFCLYITVSQLLIMGDYNHAVTNVLFSLIYYIFCVIGLDLISQDQVYKLAHLFINISLPLLIVEGIYRWRNPIIYQNNIIYGRTYYQYKYNSLMFEDSNYVGILLLCLFFLCIYLERKEQSKMFWQKLILAILTIATLSKAAIATLLIFFILLEMKGRWWIKVLLLSLAAMFGLSDYIAQIISDGSLYGKMNIFTSTATYLKNAPWYRLLFGVGFGNTKNVITLGAHNLLTTYVVEAGFVGLAMLLILWGMIIRDTNKKVLYVMAPVFLDAMSLIGHAIPFVYCAFAIIYSIETKEKDEVTTYEISTYGKYKTKLFN